MKYKALRNIDSGQSGSKSLNDDKDINYNSSNIGVVPQNSFENNSPSSLNNIESTILQDKKNINNNKNTINMLKKCAKKIPIPHVQAAAHAIDAVDKATGGQVTQGLAKGMNDLSNKNPMMNQVQNASNLVNDGNMNSGDSSKSGGLLSNNIMSFKMAKSLKFKLILCCSIVGFFLLFFVSITGSADHHNLDLTNNSGMTSKSNSYKTLSTNEIEDMLIYVGDSRIVGLESAINKSNIEYIAEVGSGYNFLSSTANSRLENLLNEDEDRIVVLSHGVNDLYNIDNYISYYYNLMASYPNTHFYIMSVNPIDESLTGSNGYNVSTSDIVNFNNKLQSNFPNNYIDIYSDLSTIGTIDGLHYDNDTYNNIHNLVTNKLSSIIKVSYASSGELLKDLEDVANWYIENVATYNQGLKLPSPFTTSNVRADCTGFAVAYMSYVSGVDIQLAGTALMVYPDGNWAESVKEHGWNAYSSDDIGALQPGDVLIAHSGALYSKTGEHAEIYVSETETFGWGSAKKSFPTNNTITISNEGGHVHFKDYGHDYITVYRYG